jgi:hypothetical protein
VIPPLVILVNTFKEIATMNKWNNLLAVLDQALGFPNRQSSKVMKRTQGFDNKTQEHVVWLEYRVRVDDDAPPPIPDEQKAREARNMAYLKRVAADLAAGRNSRKQ